MCWSRTPSLQPLLLLLALLLPLKSELVSAAAPPTNDNGYSIGGYGSYGYGYQTPQEQKYPCAFIDTVNVSGSYAYDSANVTYGPELVATYDFIIHNGERVPAERHLRACVCKLKPCIRFCCAPARIYDIKNQTCGVEVASTLDQEVINVRLENGSTRTVATAVHFSVHIGVPCETMRFITKDNRIVQWTLYENGTIAHRNFLFSKHYCYTPLQLERAGWEWQPLACAPEKLPFALGVREWTYAICLIIAVICMVIILFVYLLCHELRNTFYGVAIKAYTICIVIGYSLLAHITLTDPGDMSKFACAHIPCFIVLYLVLSFYILSFIGFNFYLNFHGVILTRLMFWLTFFPIVGAAIGWSLFIAYDHYGGKPVFNGDICWFDPRNWSIVVYFYAPILAACALSCFFYVLTLIRINDRRNSIDAEVAKAMARIERNRFGSFWKFFGYTIATWLVCLAAFAINYYRGERTHINYAVCLFVALQGFGALYALIGRNQQIQNFLRKIEEDADDDDICVSAVPMTNL